MSLMVKGTHVRIVLDSGAALLVPARYGLLHDPTGREWPFCSVLVGPYREGRRRPIEPSSKVRQYFGRKASLYEGEVTMPPRAMKEWRQIGTAIRGRIYYLRGGTKYPGRFRHRFNKGWTAMLLGKKGVVIYRAGRFLRIELPDGCTIDDRGFVIP